MQVLLANPYVRPVCARRDQTNTVCRGVPRRRLSDDLRHFKQFPPEVDVAYS